MSLALVAIAGAGLALVGYESNVLRALEHTTVDSRFSIRGKEKPPPELVVVGIDDKTFSDLADERWPFTHDLHAAVVDRIRRDGAKVIALNIQLSEPSNTDAQTLALVDAIHRAGNVVVSTTGVDDLGNGIAFWYIVPERTLASRRRGAVNDFLRREMRVAIGYGGFPNDPGGVVRRVAHETDGLKAFSLLAAQEATGRRIDRDTLGGDKAWVDYYGPPGTIRHVSYGDVRFGRTRPGEFRDKVVVVGPTTRVVEDVHPTPTSGAAEMAGPEIQAHAIATAIRGFPLKELPAPLVWALTLLLALGVVVVFVSFSPMWALAGTFAIAVTFLIASQLAFEAGAIVPVVYPLAGLLFTSMGAVTLRTHYSGVDFQREQLRQAFARFLPEPVVEELIRAKGSVSLESSTLESTVLFCDLRDFTAFSEPLPPDRVIAVLNRYLSEMSDAILDHGGTIVSYMGDGIMAVFGAPIAQPDHADRAVAAAREMLTKRLPRFNDWLRADGLSETGFRMGIGLSSGPVMSGSVGSERRLEYAAIGDTTNTAARLETMTKETEHQALVSETTWARMSGDRDALSYFDEISIRGRSQPMKVWRLS